MYIYMYIYMYMYMYIYIYVCVWTLTVNMIAYVSSLWSICLAMTSIVRGQQHFYPRSMVVFPRRISCQLFARARPFWWRPRGG